MTAVVAEAHKNFHCIFASLIFEVVVNKSQIILLCEPFNTLNEIRNHLKAEFHNQPAQI